MLLQTMHVRFNIYHLKSAIWIVLDYTVAGNCVQRHRNAINEAEGRRLNLLRKKDPVEVKNVDAWHSAFTVFVAIYTERLLQAGLALMKHSATVQNLAKMAGKYAALQYDTAFRKLRENNPTAAPWDVPHTELYNKALDDGLSYI